MAKRKVHYISKDKINSPCGKAAIDEEENIVWVDRKNSPLINCKTCKRLIAAGKK